MQVATMLILFLILLAPLASVASEGTEAPDLRVGVSVSRMFGDTKYEMNALAEDPAEPGTLVDIRSELTFPLDVTLLGLTVSWKREMATAHRWALAAGIHKNITDPSSKMTDEDWVDGRQYSFTESNAELDMLLLAADVYYLLRQGRRTALSLFLRFEYQRIEQHLVGFEGWRGSLFTDQRYPVSGTAPVIDYEVEYFSPQLGALGDYMFSDFFRLALQASAGAVFASDTDDHLLRGRISEGNGWGIGLNSRLALDLLPGFVPWDWLSTSLTGELRFFHAEGDVDQRWYRDEDLPAGTEILDVPYQLESLQAQIGVSVGISF